MQYTTKVKFIALEGQKNVITPYKTVQTDLKYHCAPDSAACLFYVLSFKLNWAALITELMYHLLLCFLAEKNTELFSADC